MRLLTDGLIPLAVAFALVVFLADTARIDTSDLRRNDLLMTTRPFFRSVPGIDPLVLALASSAVLFLAAVITAVVVGVPLGVLHGWSSSTRMKPAAWAVSTVAVSLPPFFWAVSIELVMVFIYLNTDWRFLPIAGFGLDEHLVLPTIALAARPTAYIFRLTSIAVDAIRHSDYVRTAIAKGLGTRLLLSRHVLPNAAPSIIASTLLGARGVLSSLLIVEFVYVWGGAALIFVQALGQRRLETATIIAVAFAVMSVMLTLGAELAESRIRARAAA